MKASQERSLEYNWFWCIAPKLIISVRLWLLNHYTCYMQLTFDLQDLPLAICLKFPAVQLTGCLFSAMAWLTSNPSSCSRVPGSIPASWLVEDSCPGTGNSSLKTFKFKNAISRLFRVKSHHGTFFDSVYPWWCLMSRFLHVRGVGDKMFWVEYCITDAQNVVC